jgi:hypothetical protein
MLTKKLSRLLILMVILLVVFASCQSVKPYQRAFLNDRDMQFGSQTAEGMELKAQAYREGASGAGKGKTSGGCGCK